MLISDWSSDVCSSDLSALRHPEHDFHVALAGFLGVVGRQWWPHSRQFLRYLGPEPGRRRARWLHDHVGSVYRGRHGQGRNGDRVAFGEFSFAKPECRGAGGRSEEHTSELQSLMRISYAVFCLKKKKRTEQE